MISHLSGKIILRKEDFIILDVNGIGFKIFLSSHTFNKLAEQKENLKLFTYLDIGEKSLKLYGFLTEKEFDIFEKIRNISGIGPKAALEISALNFEKLKKEVEKENYKFFEGLPGIGREKAKKIIFEISGKILKETAKEKTKEDETFLALVNLGFPKDQVLKVLLKIPKEIKDTETKIKKALEILGK